MSYISADQLASILEKVKAYIQSSSGSGGDLTDFTTRLETLENVATHLKGSITVDELNAGAYLKYASGLGMRFIKHNASIMGVSLVLYHTAAGWVELVFTTLTASADGATLARSSTSSGNKRPNINLAFRQYVSVALYGDKTNAPAGISKWQVIELADATGFLNGLTSGSGGDAAAIPTADISSLVDTYLS